MDDATQLVASMPCICPISPQLVVRPGVFGIGVCDNCSSDSTSFNHLRKELGLTSGELTLTMNTKQHGKSKRAS